MGVIRIQERAAGEHETTAVVSFEHGVEYPIQVRDPFADDPQQEIDLEWYFEEYLTFPFTQDVRAKNVAKSIQLYGESLFTQVFADPSALAAYKQARQQGLHTLQIEIAGSSAFHCMHWEALYDPEFEEYLSLHAAMVRKNITPQTSPATMQPAPTINVLVVVARPGGSRDVGYRTISRPLMDELEKTKLPVEVTLLRPGTYQALVTHLEQVTRAYRVGYYHLIHFDVHGALLDSAQLERGAQMNRYFYASRFGRPALEAYKGEKAFLFLEGEQDEQADPVEAGELAKLLRQHQIPMVLLNACQSGKLSGEVETSLGNKLIQAGVQAVVAMGYSVTVSAAEVLMKNLYQALFEKKPLPEALCLARQALANRKERRAYYNQVIELEDWLLPILYQNQEVQFALQRFTPQEEVAFYQGKAAQYRSPQLPSYGFVGRDLDILQIEKRLLLKRNLLLVRGMGGAGKTTLLHHLASWWQRTGFVQEVFYFGYDERAWSRQQIMHTIARNLLDKYELLTFQSLSAEAQQIRITQLLKSVRHLLILDNLESITAAPLAVQHTLSRKEQEHLRLLLADLVGGQTLVLLGSRSAEAWLAKGTFEEQSYELVGLDPEAASQLAERILERHHAIKYQQNKDLRALLQLLDGFPLALEVVLANLAQQTPTGVIAALQAGGTTLQVGESDKRTENILKCVEYSYRNLSPEAQQLLLCLAPFTSVIWRDMLDQYMEQLKQQPALTNLSFENWDEVIRETEKWGLLSVDPDAPLFLHIQPIFPYFLRQWLALQESQDRRTAIYMAFYNHYAALSDELLSLINSMQAPERQLGLLLTRYEYENLLTALRFAVHEKVSFKSMYSTLDLYLERLQDDQRSQELDGLFLGEIEKILLEEMTEGSKKEWIDVLNAIATNKTELKQYELAKDLYSKVLQMLECITLDNYRYFAQARTYHNLGVMAQEHQLWERAEQYYQQTLRFYAESNSRHVQAETYHQLGNVALERRQWEQAEQYYQQALQILSEFGNRYKQAKTYHNLGVIAQNRYQWGQAEQYYQQALQIFIEYNDRHAQAGSYHELGNIAQEKQQWRQAEQYYQQALQIFIEHNDRHSQAITYRQLGSITEKLRQWEQAENYCQQALQIFIEYNDRYAQAKTYHSLGNIAQEQWQREKAEQYYQRALHIFEEYNAFYEKATTHHSLGNLAGMKERWEEAEQYYHQALQIFSEYSDWYAQAGTYHQLGNVAGAQERWEQAEQYYQQALQIFGQFKDRYSQADIYHNMAIIAAEQRKWSLAENRFFEALCIFIEYTDSYKFAMVFRGLIRLWPQRKDVGLIEKVVSILGMAPEEVEKLFQQLTEDTAE